MRGNPAPYTNNAKKAASKETACQQIKEFTRQVRGNITRTLTSEDQKLFKPHKMQHRCMLKQIAIIDDTPAINCNISLYEGEQDNIAEAFVHLSRTTAKKNCKEFVQQTKQLIPVKLKLNGKASWDSTLDRTNEMKARTQHDMLDVALDEQQNSQDICTWKKGDTHYGESAPQYFQCPKCEHVEQSSCKNFQTKDLDTKQRCNGCNISTKVSEWKCTCRNHWHNCDVHRHCVPVMNATKMSVRKRERNSEDMEDAARTNQAPKLDYSIPMEQMLEQEIRQEKRKRMEEDEWMNSPTFELGFPRIKTIRVATLTPNLKRKFIHPGGL